MEMCEDCGMKFCRIATAKMEIACRGKTLQDHRNGVSENNGRGNIFTNYYGAMDEKGHDLQTVKDVPDIIVIDDDDESGQPQDHSVFDDVELSDGNDEYESNADSISQRKYRVALSNCSDKHEEHINEDLKNDASPQLSRCLYRRVRKGEKRPVQILFDNTRISSSSSDCEIIEDMDGKFQREWERAALRKQLTKVQSCQAESEESTTITNPGNSARNYLHINQSRQFAETSPSIREQSDPCQSGSSLPCFLKVRESMPILFDQQDSNHVSSDPRLESYSDLADGSETTSSSLRNDVGSFNEETSSSELFPSMVRSDDDVSKVSPTVKGFRFLRHGRDELQCPQSSTKMAYRAAAVERMPKRSVDQYVERECWQSAANQGKQQKVEVDNANLTNRKSKRRMFQPVPLM